MPRDVTCPVHKHVERMLGENDAQIKTLRWATYALVAGLAGGLLLCVTLYFQEIGPVHEVIGRQQMVISNQGMMKDQITAIHDEMNQRFNSLEGRLDTLIVRAKRIEENGMADKRKEAMPDDAQTGSGVSH